MTTSKRINWNMEVTGRDNAWWLLRAGLVLLINGNITLRGHGYIDADEMYMAPDDRGGMEVVQDN